MQDEESINLIDTVLIDIDGTITVSKRKSPFAVTPLEHLTRLVMDYYNITRADALSKINKTGNVETVCLFNFLENLKIPKDVYWNALKADVENGIEIADDAIFFIRKINCNRIRLFSATTNSRMVTLLKLSTGNLGGIDGSPYFSGFFGGDSFNDPLGKFSRNFFPSILKAGKFNPSKTMMIGDDEKRDLFPALEAGIKTIAIIDRSQRQSLIMKNGAFFVNSLRVVYDMLNNACLQTKAAS